VRLRDDRYVIFTSADREPDRPDDVRKEWNNRQHGRVRMLARTGKWHFSVLVIDFIAGQQRRNLVIFSRDR